MNGMRATILTSALFLGCAAAGCLGPTAPGPAAPETPRAGGGTEDLAPPQGGVEVSEAARAATGTPDAPEPLGPVPEPDSEGAAGGAAGGPADAETTFRRLLEGMGVRYLPEEGRLEVDGWVNMQKGLVEVFACAPEGKTHESVVVLDCVPSAIHAGLLALGLEPGTPVEVGTDGTYRMPEGPPVEIAVRWKDAAGREHVARAEDWIWNEKEGRPMQRGHWLFTGSFLQPLSDDPEDVTYAANYVKSIVTTYHDATTVLENPYSEGADDTVYYANEKAVPPVGTRLTAIFKPAR